MAKVFPRNSLTQVDCQEERRAREAKRNKTAAATKVQALIRGHLARCRHRKQARNELVEAQKRIQNLKSPPDLKDLRLCCVLVLHGGEGGSWCCGLLVKHREILLPAIAQDSDWCFLMCRLLGRATHILSTADSNASLAPPLRWALVIHMTTALITMILLLKTPIEKV